MSNEEEDNLNPYWLSSSIRRNFILKRRNKRLRVLDLLK